MNILIDVLYPTSIHDFAQKATVMDINEATNDDLCALKIKNITSNG